MLHLSSRKFDKLSELERKLDNLSELVRQRKYPLVDGPELHPPLGTISEIYDPTAELNPHYSNLKDLPDLNDRIARDQLPIPHAANSSGYSNRPQDYWLSGLSDYLKVSSVAQQYSCNLKRLYDFGGSSGRVFRHFFCQTGGVEVWSSDFERSTHRWNQLHFPQQIRTFLNTAFPHLPISDEFFDVITAFSVFTHLDELEIPWLLELRRILRPGGILYISIHDETYWPLMSPWMKDSVLSNLGTIPEKIPGERLSFIDTHFNSDSYNSDSYYNTQTFYTSDYIRREWGRFFKVLEIRPRSSFDHAVVLLTR